VVQAAFNEEVTKRTVIAVLATEREKVMNDVRKRLADEAKQFGIEVVDVRIKRVDFSANITESVYRRMESERKRVANEPAPPAQPRARRSAPMPTASAKSSSEAYRDAQKIKGEGDAKASALYAEAFGATAVRAVLPQLEAYRPASARSDVMVVDPQRLLQGHAGLVRIGRAGAQVVNC
jgi:membrane protease subunit HflC